MRYFFFVLSFAGSLSAVAAPEGSHHAATGIPNVVWLQALNFGLFVVALYFLLKNKVSTYFKERSAGFQQALLKAEKSRAEAEAQRRSIETRLHELQQGADNSLAQAKAEAEELRQKIVRDAQETAVRLQEEARRTAEVELMRAKSELREEVLSQAVEAAKKILSEKIAETDQKRLQNEFVEKIQVVR